MATGSYMTPIYSRSQTRRKKPHIIAEELILPAAIEIIRTMFGDNFAKELLSIPLSNDTVSRRIDDIAEDVEQQLFGKLRDKLFSIQLDETTDNNKDAHFIAYVRFWDGFVPSQPHSGLLQPKRGGRGSRVVWASDRGWLCHEFEPSTTKDPPCRAAMHAKSVES
ncbi:SCAN domain-containing protein 3 [Trichonephila clavipes]|nr:SCAN domain-containing protein 3 [Trichonephila clavipes]